MFHTELVGVFPNKTALSRDQKEVKERVTGLPQAEKNKCEGLGST